MYARIENNEVIIYHQLPATLKVETGAEIHNFHKADSATLAQHGFLEVRHNTLPENYIYGDVVYDINSGEFTREILYAFAQIDLTEFKKMKARELISSLDEKFSATQDVYEQYNAAQTAIPDRIAAIRSQCQAKKQILLTSLSSALSHEEVVTICNTLSTQIQGIEDFDLADEYFSEPVIQTKSYKIEKSSLPPVAKVKQSSTGSTPAKSKYKIIRIIKEAYRLIRIKVILWYYHFKTI